MKEDEGEINKQVAKLFLSFGNDNLKKLLKEMRRGCRLYKTLIDIESQFRKIEKLLNV